MQGLVAGGLNPSHIPLAEVFVGGIGDRDSEEEACRPACRQRDMHQQI